MADGSAQQDIRGLDIDKLAKGFADEVIIMKRFCQVSKTKARSIRWYKKNAGFLDSTDTTGITASQIANTSFKALPVVVEQKWTRQSSDIKKFFVQSPLIPMEDIKDTDIDILATNIRDLVRAVANQVDISIWDVITDGIGINTTAAIGTGWDDAISGNPIKDIIIAKRKIRVNNYDPEGAVLMINPIEEENLLDFLINVKGSSIPGYSTEKIKSGVVMGLLGLQVVVNNVATTDEALVFVPKVACSWKSFAPISSAVIDEPGIGKTIRVWEEGIAILTDPSAVSRITDTVT